MKSIFQNRSILVIVLAFIVILIGAAILTGKFGMALSSRFSAVIPPQNNDPVQTREKKIIKRITVDKEDGSGCIQVGADGIIRVYAVCDGEATDAAREQDMKVVQDLFKRISETSFSDVYKRKCGKSIKVTIETDTGIEVIYIPIDNSGEHNSGIAAQIDEIVKTIETITEEVSQPTPTQTPPPTPEPTLPPGITATPSPTETPINPFATPSPTPIVSPEPKPFSCGFTEEGNGQSPYNISNYVCTTEPTPGI